MRHNYYLKHIIVFAGVAFFIILSLLSTPSYAQSSTKGIYDPSSAGVAPTHNDGQTEAVNSRTEDARSHSTLARSSGIYVELLGASQGIGVGYDARFRDGTTSGLGWRAGLGFGYAYSSNFVAFNIDDNKIDLYNQIFRLAAPVELNYLMGNGKSKLEAGLGTALCMDLYTSDSGAKPDYSVGIIPYASLGYRLVTDRGFLFRAGLMSTLGFSGSSSSLYPYLSFGKAF